MWSRKASWASGSTDFELLLLEPTYQPKKATKWSAFVNMPGSFAQAVAGAQNLPQRHFPSQRFLNSMSSAGTKKGSASDESDRKKNGDYV